MKTIIRFHIVLLSLAFFTCNSEQKKQTTEEPKKDDFQYQTEQFADLSILRYRIPGFDSLTLKQKEMLYYLSQAALCGRDIIWDQNFKHNLCIRKTLETIIASYKGDKNTEDFKNFMVYAKRVFFSNGIHHHYGSKKIMPEFSKEYFAELVKSSPDGKFPLQEKETIDDLVKKLTPILFDEKIAAKKVNLDPKEDLVAGSASNNYEGVTQKEVEAFYAKMVDKKNTEPISYGLNSKLVKENGKLIEKKWKVGGMYSQGIEKIVFWLEKASVLAENENQKKALDFLIEFYKTGDLKKFDDYNIAWVADTNSVIDVVNGFIEVYGDPIGYRGAYESVVSIKDMEASKRIEAISRQAQWFEDHSPLMPEHKKEKVTGISAKVITAVMEAGDAAPSTPIGINLPNANWIRAKHGSKSVNLGNIVYAYSKSASNILMLTEFAFDTTEIELHKKYAALSDNLHTDMHEVIGHASGKINPGVGQPNETLKNYSNTLEEARADLVALYYIIDPKLVEIGVMPATEVGKAEYNSYIRNGMMTQLTRLKLGDQLEESHMRNRQLNAQWCYEKGMKDNVIEKVKRDGKTYFVVRNYEKLRELFGELLKEIQRIKSEGDYKSAHELVENYGVKVDAELHKEILDRFEKLKTAPYKGFIQPKLIPIMNGDQIADVKVEYPENFTEQMLYFGKEYGLLPVYN